MGRAERTPEAMMVSNDMPSAPALRAAYSISAAISTSLIPGRITPERGQTGQRRSHRRADRLNLLRLLNHPGLFDQRRASRSRICPGSKSAKRLMAAT